MLEGENLTIIVGRGGKGGKGATTNTLGATESESPFLSDSETNFYHIHTAGGGGGGFSGVFRNLSFESAQVSQFNFSVPIIIAGGGGGGASGNRKEVGTGLWDHCPFFFHVQDGRLGGAGGQSISSQCRNCGKAGSAERGGGAGCTNSGSSSSSLCASSGSSWKVGILRYAGTNFTQLEGRRCLF